MAVDDRDRAGEPVLVDDAKQESTLTYAGIASPTAVVITSNNIETAALAPGSLTVILKHDGNWPSMDCLLAQMERARAAMARGRARRIAQMEFLV